MKKALIWIVSIILTLSAALYQKMSGPTYPLRLATEINDEDFNFQLIRSASIEKGCMVEIPAHDGIEQVKLFYRKYPGDFQFDTITMHLSDGDWISRLPVQPAAGKLEYYVQLFGHNGVLFENKENPAIVRFKGEVPAVVLIPHIIAMFLAMLFSVATTFMAILKIGNFRRMALYTLGLLIFGGLVLGPIVQYYAFGEAWTGWPVGHDLTDNKTLIAAVFWIGAVIANIRKPRKWAVIIATIVLMLVYIIPHSAWGSEYDYESGQVQTGNKG